MLENDSAGLNKPAPLGRTSVIDTSFKRVAVDINVPLKPPSLGGNRSIVTVVDHGTRFPDDVALPSIETDSVAIALVKTLSRVGVPDEILSDRGSIFISELMKEFGRLLSLRQLNTASYHPMANGLAEKFDRKLKSMLRRMCAELP